MHAALETTVLFVCIFVGCICDFASTLPAQNDSNSSVRPLPKCTHIDPYKDIVAWSEVNANLSGCDPTSGIRGEDLRNAKEQKNYQWGLLKFAYDVVTSDKIGPRRHLEPMYHHLCENISYDEFGLKASVVIIYHNEAVSVLIRMINSIFDRTPERYLKEIVLYDDYSDMDVLNQELIEKYGKIAGWNMKKIINERSEERLGLIRAKTFASRLATGDVLIFLDSHCEVTKLWIEPLLAAIKEDPTRAVLPLVDIIDPLKFEYSKAMVCTVAFDWKFNFNWKYFPWKHFDIPEHNYELFKSPIMSGGLFAIKTAYFRDMGEYDIGMKIWGAENIELSLRLWLCGGSVVVAPCSHVGHVFRRQRPYTSPDAPYSNLYNSLRTVKVWLDDYEKYFFIAHPSMVGMDPGDLSERIALKKRLNCKSFQWYIDEIDPSLKDTPEKRKEEL